MWFCTKRQRSRPIAREQGVPRRGWAPGTCARLGTSSATVLMWGTSSAGSKAGQAHETKEGATESHLLVSLPQAQHYAALGVDAHRLGGPKHIQRLHVVGARIPDSDLHAGPQQRVGGKP